jgi:hypothetical protein
MSAAISAPLEMVEAVAALGSPAASDRRLQVLMDRNNEGALSPDELESLAELSKTISLVRADALALLGRAPHVVCRSGPAARSPAARSPALRILPDAPIAPGATASDPLR